MTTRAFVRVVRGVRTKTKNVVVAQGCTRHTHTHIHEAGTRINLHDARNIDIKKTHKSDINNRERKRQRDIYKIY